MFDVRQRHSAVRVLSLAILTTLVLALALPAFAQPDTQLLGPEDQSKQINVTYWLKLHNQAAFDELLRQQYDPDSPNYHHWLTPSEYQARFAPTAADMAVVRKHLAENNLKEVRADKFNHAVTASGTVRDIQCATGVQMNRVLINGEERRVGNGPLNISGPAGKLVYEVQGLTDIRYKNMALRPIDPDSGKPFAMYPLPKSDVTSHKITQYFNPLCMRFTQKIHLTTPGNSKGPYESYSGTRYGSNITSGPPNLPPCGYDASQIQAAYGMRAVYAKGWWGNNQNIVIVDAYGDDAIASDANAFSSINNLPPLTTNNFGIFYPTGTTSCGGDNSSCGNWFDETALDVEWSHAMAPRANVALVLAADNSGTNLDLAELFAAETGLGPVISNSWGIEEYALITQDPGELIVENNISKTAASLGVSANFSSGDSGDFKAADKVITVLMPASAPYSTGVGGTSLFLHPNYSINVQTGWGNNLARIATYTLDPPTCGNPPLNPCDPVLLFPEFLGFYAGAGGGTSAYWAKPSYQKSVAGTNRMVPDIAFLADPYTGVEIIVTAGGTQSIGVIGGTSLAAPMFSGLWAVATQAAGKWLGQAAPLLYRLPANALTDIVAVSGPDNVSGLTDSPPLAPINFTAAQLAAPLENSVDQVDFMSLLYQGISTRWYTLSFGVDTTLNAGPGWDNVTGLGTPNGLNFVEAVVGKK